MEIPELLRDSLRFRKLQNAKKEKARIPEIGESAGILSEDAWQVLVTTPQAGLSCWMPADVPIWIGIP